MEVEFIDLRKLASPESLLAERWFPFAVNKITEETYFVDVDEPWKKGFWLDSV